MSTARRSARRPSSRALELFRAMAEPAPDYPIKTMSFFLKQPTHQRMVQMRCLDLYFMHSLGMATLRQVQEAAAKAGVAPQVWGPTSSTQQLDRPVACGVLFRIRASVTLLLFRALPGHLCCTHCPACCTAAQWHFLAARPPPPDAHTDPLTTKLSGPALATFLRRTWTI